MPSGGVYVIGMLRTTHVTITQNEANADRRGLDAGSGISLENLADARLTTTIVADNRNGFFPFENDILGPGSLSANSSFNLIGSPFTAGGLQDGVNGNIVGFGGFAPLPISLVLNPVLANNGGPTQTHSLTTFSQAIDAGPSTTSLQTDQRGAGFTRLSGAAVDIGAFEVL